MTHPNSPDAQDMPEFGYAAITIEANRICAERDDTLANVIADLQNVDAAELEEIMYLYFCEEDDKPLTNLFFGLLKKQAQKNLEQLALEGEL